MENEKQMDNPSNNKKYKWEMIFKNGMKINGRCEFPNLNTVYEVFLKNNFNHVANDTKRILL